MTHSDDYNDFYRQMMHKMQAQMQMQNQMAAQKLAPDPIEAATDDKLILELIARGYAVWRPNPEEK